MDLAIFDEQYTPYIFNHGVLKFIPVEAVAAVIECKSSVPDNNKVEAWLSKMNNLMTSQESVVRIAGRMVYGSDEVGAIDGAYLNTQTATRPIKILCYISSSQNARCQPKKEFDIVLEANEKQEKLGIVFSEKFKSLYDWYMDLNHTEKNKKKIEKFLKESKEKGHNYKNRPIADIEKLENYKLNQLEIGSSEKNNLLSFIFQLNQLLMLINNPIFFPHMAYVKMFNEFLEEDIDKETEE